MNMNFDKYKQWSLIDPRPVVYYEPSIDEWCVFWNGIFMLHSSALILAGVMLLNSPSSKEVINQADYKFKKLYKAGLFNDIERASGQPWNDIVDNYSCSGYYVRSLSNFIRENLKDYTKMDVWNWFTKIYE